MDPFLRHLASQLESQQARRLCPGPCRWVPKLEPECGATADDVGATLPSIGLLPLLSPPFVAARTFANLSLQTAKCAIVPLAGRCSDAVVQKYRQQILTLIPAWADFKIAGSTEFLGMQFGPAAELDAQWAAPTRKWRERVREIALSRSPTDASCRIYNFGAITVLSYLCQLFPPPVSLLRAERHVLHRLLRLPPNSFGLAELLSI
eukprot:3734352-Pyramimonas_sp.AAC.1